MVCALGLLCMETSPGQPSSSLQWLDHHVISVWILIVNFVISAPFGSFALALSMLNQVSRRTSTSATHCIKGPYITRSLILLVLLVRRLQLVPRGRLPVLKYLSLNLKRVPTCAQRYSCDDWRRQAVKSCLFKDSWAVPMPALPKTLAPVCNAATSMLRARH